MTAGTTGLIRGALSLGLTYAGALAQQTKRLPGEVPAQIPWERYKSDEQGLRALIVDIAELGKRKLSDPSLDGTYAQYRRSFDLHFLTEWLQHAGADDLTRQLEADYRKNHEQELEELMQLIRDVGINGTAGLHAEPISGTDCAALGRADRPPAGQCFPAAAQKAAQVLPKAAENGLWIVYVGESPRAAQREGHAVWSLVYENVGRWRLLGRLRSLPVDIPAAFEECADDIFAYLRAGRKEQAVAAAERLILPDPQSWFAEVFGPKGGSAAAEYQRELGSGRARLIEEFERLLKDGKTVVSVLGPMGTGAANSPEVGVYAAMKKRVELRKFAFSKPNEPQAREVLSGYVVYVGDAWRWVGPLRAISGEKEQQKPRKP